MSVAKADFTMTFRGLSELTIDELRERTSPKYNWALKRLSKHVNWSDWVEHYYHRLQKYVYKVCFMAACISPLRHLGPCKQLNDTFFFVCYFWRGYLFLIFTLFCSHCIIIRFLSALNFYLLSIFSWNTYPSMFSNFLILFANCIQIGQHFSTLFSDITCDLALLTYYSSNLVSRTIH